MYLRGGTRGWAIGNEAVAGWVFWTISDYPYRIVPVAYSQDGTSARVVGYYMDGEGWSQRFGTSLLALTKGGDGVWRIGAETYVFEEPKAEEPKTAADAVAMLDSVGTRRAAVVSNAYYFDAARPEPVRDPYPHIRAENDWLAEQVAHFPDRLVAFCSVGNPTREYALPELHRCASTGNFLGLKRHFNAAQLNHRDADEVARVRAVMAAANQYRMPMIIHVRPGNLYGREEAEIFLRQLVAAAPDVPIQIAHLWGGESYSAPALEGYANAVASGDAVARNLFFDVAAVLMQPRPPEQMQEIVASMRKIGLDRILWGSDAPPVEAWAGFREHVPLTEAEFRQIAGNVAPYLQGPELN